MKLMVIDGNSIINRSFYGVRPLTTREGLPTNAVYGFVTTLQRLLEEEQPEGLCVTFDRREPTFRHLSYAGYKAQRKGMPEELAQQLPVLKEVLDAMDIPRYELAGFEADDLIGTISRRCEAAGWDCVVVTGDKDSLQLITDHTMVKLVSTRMGQTTTKDMTPGAFREVYGFDPIHMVDLKALMGDASDNIPGVPGVGEKTAMALVQQYGSVDAIYSALPDDLDAKPGVIKKLTAGEESARMSYRLATIVTDAPLDFVPAENLRRPAKPALHDLFLRLEFSKLIEKMGLAPAAAPAAEKGDEAVPGCTSEVVTEGRRMAELLDLFRRLDHVSCLALPELGGVCAAWGETEGNRAALFLPSRLDCYNDFLKAFFAPDIRKVSHEVKDLTRALLAEELPAEGFIFDTALAGYLLDATAGHYDLEHLAMTWFNMAAAKPLYLSADAFTPLGVDGEALEAWMSHTALVESLYGAMLPKLQETGVEELYFTVELPLCRVLAEMELAGFRVDAGMLSAFGDTLSAAIGDLEQRIYAHAGQFNINSPKQLGEILFGKLGLPHGKKTKTGWSTNADVLEKLRYEAPIVGAVLEYRQYAKLKSTYADGLLKALDSDGRIRTSFQMTVTATGRLSSAEPNLQNIPTRTDLGSEIRRMFLPAEGCVLVDADYSQIELRLLAHISGDEAMRAAFLSGGDFHAETAAKVFHVAPGDVTPEMRRSAKAVNFGIVYGISAFSLSQDIGVTVAEAKEYMEAYFATFPGVRRYMDAVVEQAREDGYVETIFHRRRDLPELKSSNFNLRSFGERVALNMPIQGTAADIMKLAMIAVDRRLRSELPEARLVLQVHDELIVECPEDQASQAAALLEEEMERVAPLSVPLTAEAHWGKNWLEAKG